MDVTVRKLGVTFSPAALVITYSDGLSVRRRTIPVRNISKNSNIQDLMAEMRSLSNHRRYLDQISHLQLMKMLTLIKDHLNGLSLDDSLAKSKRLDHIDPNEDLNTADDETLDRKKAAMNESFVKNQKKASDADFKYDIEVDFGTNDAVETVNWSDEDDDFGF
ncbi:centrosomal protein of 19 kDa-like [Watersipora subatra]|uniref:centrosomal protein of 19 kDa-like n=1 Tax=Watersipora subatra TaxID=2589382 RepID=UPI00355C6E1C